MYNIEPLVSVFCATYNHEKYIRQCLEGFVMQQTSFQFEIIVQDDASTDGTSKIVREFAKKYSFIIPRIHEVNIYSQGKNINEYFYNNAKGKYIAWCEGDDYWTDPYKLQKQVDFLKANPEHGMVATLFSSILEGNVIPAKKTQIKLNNWGNISFNDLLIVNPIGTLTVMVRSDVFIPSIKSLTENLKCFISGDAPLWLEIALRSKVAILKEDTANYRILSESASHSEDINKEILYINDYFETRKYYIDKYIIGNSKKEILHEVEWDHKRRLFNLYKNSLQPKYLLVNKRDIFRFRLSKSTLKDIIYTVSIYCKPLRSLIKSIKNKNRVL